ncbi:MAG: hypothetical protein COX62_03505 [Deltaproteobacteria bacterium CG_4_10_14_0_2_um_filter_43_8]|nr:MAG: hypothetical protein COX62_03505 [Deltaproteobacteria bacterium CG_4_10_14_0_2_um_filter_43_8]
MLKKQTVKIPSSLLRKSASNFWNNSENNIRNYTMEHSKDFEEFFALLNKHNVHYLVVGGYAVVFHGYPRFTGDIDIYYQAEKKNIESLLSALKEFGFDFDELNVAELSQLGQVVQLGQAPNRIDLLNKVDGLNFEHAWKSKVESRYGTENIFYISFDDLLKNKKTVNREQDRADVEYLKQKLKKR